MELFGIGKRELDAKFTKSELVILAWRSQELSASFEKETKVTGKTRGRQKQYDASVPEGLPDHFYNEDGEIDLRNVTGEEAYKYMQSVGVKLPIFRGSRDG